MLKQCAGRRYDQYLAMEGSDDAQDGTAVQSFYAVLNVAPEASDEDVKRAYRWCSRSNNSQLYSCVL